MTMTAKLIDGRKVADRLRQQLKEMIAGMSFQPGLGAILVGDDPASRLYVGLKEKACQEVGIRFEKILLPAAASQEEVLAAVEHFNRNHQIDAFIIQLPLPPHLDKDLIISRMNPHKDADGFHPMNLDLKYGDAQHFPVLAQAVFWLIKETGQATKRWKGLVISNSQIMFEPMKRLLKSPLGIKCRWSSPAEPDLDKHLRQADLVVVAVGQPGFIRGQQLKPGATVIDIGINRLPDGSIAGDVDAATASEVAAWLTPVPGGVGPVTVACLLSNTVLLAAKWRPDGGKPADASLQRLID